MNIDKMEFKKKTHDITQGNNENKRGVVRKMQTKSEGICGQSFYAHCTMVSEWALQKCEFFEFLDWKLNKV